MQSWQKGTALALSASEWWWKVTAISSGKYTSSSNRANFILLMSILIIIQSFSHTKIVQTECRTTSLLDCYAEVQPILCKDRNFFSYTGKFFSYTMKTAWILCLRAWLPTVLATVLIKLLIQNSKSRTARQLYIGFTFGHRTSFPHSSFIFPRFVSILSSNYSAIGHGGASSLK